MIARKFIPTSLVAALFTPLVNAQEDVWNGLARSQFDSSASTLRAPCALVEDENGNSVPGLAPAYALNLLLVSLEEGNERFQLAEPIQAFSETPESCLDTLAVSNGGSTATYNTTSTEIDIDAAVFADRFYTLELQANLSAEGPIEFSVVNASSRDYRRPIYTAELLIAFPPNPPFTTDYIYDDVFVENGLQLMNENLLVFEPGRIRFDCFYDDPSELLDLVDVVASNTRYRLDPSLTAAHNGQSFTLSCRVFNLDLNRLEQTIPVLEWSIFFQ
ncbi:MAG: hypothetical protein QGF90_15840 [Gammaproteobacteria bacterium]|jgi:hypothetical protein|nr:hypothetical protein [Gammaproteobacteria bacterium]